MIIYYILFVFAIVFSTVIRGKEKELPVIPTPQIANELPGSFQIHPGCKIIVTGDTTEESMFIAIQLKQTLKQFNRIEPGIVHEASPGSQDIVLNLLDTSDNSESNLILLQKEESYKLTIDENGIAIKSYSIKGLFYGAMTLIQLAERTLDNKIPSVEIIDWPDMKIRGISDDISRGQVSNLDNFKRIIRFISRYKMNTYMLYIEDVLKFNCYPSIGNNRGALTKDEVKELISYAKMYNVEIIPIFQTLGHYENILSEREFMKFAEFPGSASLNISSDATYEFLESMMKELFELFPTPYFHMGADESWDVGLGKSKKLVRKQGIAKAHLKHYKKIYDIAKNYGKKVIMYGDILLNNTEILKELPKDIIIVDWNYEPNFNYQSPKVFNESGFNYFVSPSVNNYNTVYPANSIAVPNIKYFIRSGIENGASGMINSNWGDFGAETFKELCLPGYAWSAQCSWDFKKSNENKFFTDFYNDFFGSNDERSLLLHELFSAPYSQIRWNELWQHPLSPVRDTNRQELNINSATRVSWLEINIPVMEKNINSLQQKVIKNREYFEILRFQTNLYDWYKTKLITQDLLKNNSQGVDVDNNLLKKLVADNILSLNKLKNKYKELWLRYNKRENLDLIEDKFNRLTKYFEEIDIQVGIGKLLQPKIPSTWIYLKKDDTTYAASARFKKEIELKQAPRSAVLQLLGDTYAKLYINGKYVDEVFARNSLSLSVEHKRMKFIDVTLFLVQGDNIITVEVENYNQKASAGFNLLSEVKFVDNSSQIIQSDDSWKVQFLDDDPDDEDEWRNVSIKEYPFYVIAPNFETKRTSWIER